MPALREHDRQFNDGRYELFKSTLQYDDDLGREQHQSPTPPSCQLDSIDLV